MKASSRLKEFVLIVIGMVVGLLVSMGIVRRRRRPILITRRTVDGVIRKQQ